MPYTVDDNYYRPDGPCWDHDSSGTVKQARCRLLIETKTYRITDFNDGTDRVYDDIPQWMHDSVALLNIAGDKVEVQGVGMKWAGRTYYLNIKGAMNEAE